MKWSGAFVGGTGSIRGETAGHNDLQHISIKR